MSSPIAASGSFPGYFHASEEELLRSLMEKERQENVEQTPYPGYFHASVEELSGVVEAKSEEASEANQADSQYPGYFHASAEDLKKLGKMKEEEGLRQTYPGHFHDSKEELEKIAHQTVENRVAPFPELGESTSMLIRTIEKVKNISAALNVKNSVVKMIAVGSFSAAIIGTFLGDDLKAGLLSAALLTASAYVGEQIADYLEKKHN